MVGVVCQVFGQVEPNLGRASVPQFLDLVSSDTADFRAASPAVPKVNLGVGPLKGWVDQPELDFPVAIPCVGESILVDSKGHQWANINAEPVGGYSTSQWQAGDVWRGQFNLPLPGDIPEGHYRLWIQPITPDGTLLELFELEPMSVTE